MKSNYEISKNIELIDLCLYLKKSKTLVISDLQLGYEEQLVRSGIFVPFRNFEKLTNRLLNVLENLDVEVVVINGDLKHEFGRINRQEWTEVMELLDFVHTFCKKLIIVKGNHDVVIQSMAKQRDIDVVDNYQIDDLFITHGDKIPEIPSDADTIIIGHVHPAISIRDKDVSETYKCFLKGKWQGKTLIVQPSFFLLVEGTDIIKHKTISPFLDKIKIKNFEVWAVADKVFYFGKVKDLII